MKYLLEVQNIIEWEEGNQASHPTGSSSEKLIKIAEKSTNLARVREKGEENRGCTQFYDATLSARESSYGKKRASSPMTASLQDQIQVGKHAPSDATERVIKV